MSNRAVSGRGAKNTFATQYSTFLTYPIHIKHPRNALQKICFTGPYISPCLVLQLQHLFITKKSELAEGGRRNRTPAALPLARRLNQHPNSHHHHSRELRQYKIFPGPLFCLPILSNWQRGPYQNWTTAPLLCTSRTRRRPTSEREFKFHFLLPSLLLSVGRLNSAVV